MYGILIRERVGRDAWKNIGDYVQSIAQMQFLKDKETCYFKKKGKNSSEKMLKIKDEYIPRNISSSTFMHFVPSKWHMSRFYAYGAEELYPLKELDFEGEMFMCPNNSDKLLRLYYSNYYMELPQ